jgi:hypothetical protein
LHSIIGASVFARSSPTIAAVIAAITFSSTWSPLGDRYQYPCIAISG